MIEIEETLETIGYYPIVNGDTIGTIICQSCWTGDLVTEDFEEIGNGSTYGYGHEFDAPVICDCCFVLIATRLTRDGLSYVLGNIQDPQSWNKYTAQWAKLWHKEIDEVITKGLDR